MSKTTTEFVSNADVALIEHKLIATTNMLENSSEKMMFYIAGLHDMANELITFIETKYPNDAEKYWKEAEDGNPCSG